MQRAISLLVVALLAGCLGGVGGTASSAAEPPDAAWTDGRGIDEATLAREHFETLRSEGSFVLNRTSTIWIDGESRPQKPLPEWYVPPSYTHASVDLDEGRLRHRSVTAGHGRRVTFVSPAVDASRRKSCDSAACAWEYDYVERPEHDTVAGKIDRYRRQRVVDMLVQIMDDWNYTFDSAVARDGTTLYRYTAEWTFDKPMHPFTEQPEGAGTLLVTRDGVIRRLEFRFVGSADVTGDGERRTVTLVQRDTIAYVGVGRTSVERPEWIERAKNRDRRPTTASADT